MLKRIMINHNLAEDAIDFGIFLKMDGMLLGIILSPWMLYFERYVFSDYPILLSLSVACFAVLAIDLAASYQLKKLNPRSVLVTLNKFLVKLFLYGFFILVISTATKYEVNGLTNTDYGWVPRVGYGAIFGREIYSAILKIQSAFPDGKNFFQTVIDRIWPKKP